PCASGQTPTSSPGRLDGSLDSRRGYLRVPWAAASTRRAGSWGRHDVAKTELCALRSDRPKRRTVALRASGRVALAVARQGSHRPVRARIRAYDSSADRFAAPEGSPWLSVRVPWTCG